MTIAKRFEDLEVWQKAKELTNLIYRFSSSGADDFQSALSLAEVCSRQLASFIRYLEAQPNARRVWEDGVYYDIQH